MCKAIETDAFGADPVFLNASKLFSAEMTKHVHICYENDTRVMNTEIKLPYGVCVCVCVCVSE